VLIFRLHNQEKTKKSIGKEIQSLTTMDHIINPPKRNVNKYATIDRILFLVEEVAGAIFLNGIFHYLMAA